MTFRRTLEISFVAFVLCSFVFTTYSQRVSGQVATPPERQFRVAERNNLYCAGYVQSSPIDTSSRLIGAVEEQDGWLYSQNNFVYVNIGSSAGIKPGDMFSVVRPRGQVKTRWTNKGRLGFYVEEVGTIEIIRVKSDVSVARVKTSCDNFLLGDLVRPF
ncbi:MAG: hypothetical protein C4325_02415, partial [Blastocatellia bacterium]